MLYCVKGLVEDLPIHPKRHIKIDQSVLSNVICNLQPLNNIMVHVNLSHIHGICMWKFSGEIDTSFVKGLCKSITERVRLLMH